MELCKVLFGVTVATLFAGLGAAQIETKADTVVSDTFYSPDFGEIRVQGLCSAKESSISCWNLDQRHDEALSKDVTEVFKAGRHPGIDRAVEVPFHFRRKTRIAVVRVPATAYQQSFSASLQGFGTKDQRYIQSLIPFTRSKGTSPTLYLPIDADQTAKVGSLFATLSWKVGHSVDIPAKEDASTTDGPQPISITSIKPTTRDVIGAPIGRTALAWRVLFRMTGDSAKSKFLLDVVPIDAKGDPISWVDSKGHPSKAPTQAEMIRSFQSPGSTPTVTSFLYPVTPNGYQPETGERQWTLGVDPKFVSALRITYRTLQTIEFKDLPFDPMP